MSRPKYVTKFVKGPGVNIEYTSKVDFTNYTILELSRTAMNDVGRYLARVANDRAAKKLSGMKYKRGTNKRIRGLTSTFKYKVPWVKTGLPHLEIGVKHNTWYGVEQELGSSKMPKLGILRNAVQTNIAKIIEIESKYLSALEDEARALSLIDESEYSGGGEDG